jgi:hypothetical protein
MKKLPKLPKGKPTQNEIKASGLRETFNKFIRMLEMDKRCRAAGVDPVAALGVKPWEAPSVGTITEEHYAILEAACEAKEKGLDNKSKA